MLLLDGGVDAKPDQGGQGPVGVSANGFLACVISTANCQPLIVDYMINYNLSCCKLPSQTACFNCM